MQRVNHSNQRGAAAVEFAIILPLLVLLIFGTIEFSLLLFNKQVITNAAREGARAGIVSVNPRPTNEEIKTVIRDYCGDQLITFGSGGGLTIPDPSPSYETRSAGGFGTELRVTVQYKYEFLVLANLGFDPVDIETVSVMKME